MEAQRNARARAGLSKKQRGKQGVRHVEVRNVLGESIQAGRFDRELLTRVMVKILDSAGECQRAEPYKPLYPVLDDVGLRYCCTHKPRHCSEYLSK